MITIFTFDNFLKIILSLVIISTPITNMPKRFTMPGLGDNLSHYFILVLLFLVSIKLFISKESIDKDIKKYFIFLFMWIILTSLYGAYCYPYYNEVTLNNSRFYDIYNLLFGKLLPSDFSIKVFLFFKSIRDGFVSVIMPWIFAYTVFYILRKEGIKGITFLIYIYIFLGIILFVYAIPEIMLFKFDMSLGKEILSITNPYLYDVNSYLGWYPPLIWHDQQLRSLCVEPATLAELSIMIVACFWAAYFKNKSNFILLVYCLYLILPIMSKSRTAVLICGFMLSQLVFYLKDKSINKKHLLNVIISSTTSIMLAITSFNMLINKDNSFIKYYDSNIKTITSTTARSNGSRLINIKNHLNVIALKPLLGTGMFYKDLYVRDNMVENALSEPEIYSITRGIEKEGVFKYSYGNVNHYVFITCSIGLLGLFIYLLPVIYVMFKSLKLGLYKNSIFISLLIAINTSLLAMNLGRPSVSFYIAVSMAYLFADYMKNKNPLL